MVWDWALAISRSLLRGQGGDLKWEPEVGSPGARPTPDATGGRGECVGGAFSG